MTTQRPQEPVASGQELTDLELHWSRIRHVQLNDFRVRALARLVLAHLRGSPILDVGCGTGAMLINLAKWGFDVRGIDVSPAMVEQARDCLRYEGLHEELVQCSDVSEVERRYSTVLSMDVIEHLDDDAGMVEAMARVLNPRGRLIVTVPALPGLFGPKDVKLGHKRRYTHSDLHALLDQAGLTVVAMRYWNTVGLIPTFVALKLSGRAVREDFRYHHGTTASMLHKILAVWLIQVENRVPFPLGLSLFAVAEKTVS